MGEILKNHIDRIVNGDESAFKDVFDAYYPRLVNFALKYHDDLMVAEDAVAEVFKNIWEMRSEIPEWSTFKSYLYVSVRNRVLNHLRHNSVKYKYQEKIQRETEEAYFEEYVLEEEVHFKLYQAIMSLPEKRRRIFELSVLHGLKEKEIAEDLGVSVNTVKTHKKRALKDLRAKLGHLYHFIFLI